MMAIMHLLYTLSLLNVLSSSVFRVNANGETKSITLKRGDITDLTSPHYPEPYGNDLEMHWNVQADLAQRILITFHDFQTEDHDALYTAEVNYPSTKAKYCGDEVATPYISLGNHLMITFTSDSTESGTGFHLSLSCLTQTEDNTYVHEAVEGSEHIRVLTQPVCRKAGDMDLADTICREAGFPGAYETSWGDTTSGLNGTSYDCNSFLSELGCFNLAEYTHLLSRSVKLSRDQCLTYCNSYSTTPHYAVHNSGTNCSCINQTALDISKLTAYRERCRTITTTTTGHWATLFNASFGFCSRPPELDNGSWNNTSNGFMYGTTINAKCNENYEFVDGDGKMRCDKATTTTNQDFEWHGTTPSCQKTNTSTRPADDESSGSGNRGNKTLWISAVVILAIMFIIVIPVCCIIGIKLRTKGKDVESLWFLRRYQINVHGGSEGRSRGTRTRSPEDTSRFHSPFGIYRLSAVVENEYISTVDIETTSDLSEYPTNIDNPIRSEVSRQDYSLSTVSTSFRSTENSTNDIPIIIPLQTASSVEETENTLTNDQTISELTSYSSARTLPSAQVSPRSRTLGAHAPPVCPLTLRPLPLLPIITDLTYAELGTQSDRANPCQPIHKEQSYKGPRSIDPKDIDVSETALGLPGQHWQLPLIPSDSLPTGVGSSNVLVPHPDEEPMATVEIDGSSRSFRPLPGQNELSDSVTSKGSRNSEGSTKNHNIHDYEDADFQMDRPTPQSMTPNSPDPGGEDFDRRMRHAQRSSSCSERKYYSIHDPRPQNKSEEIHTSQGQTPSSHDPLYFTLEREDDDTTEMIVNPLYESSEPYR